MDANLLPKLRLEGLRVTSQRKAILNALGSSTRHLTPVQVHNRATQESPGLTVPTVYRTLRQLAHSGLVWQLQLENGHLAYELAGRNHHHLVCASCGGVVEVPSTALDAIYARLERVSGFELKRDHLTLTGLCSRCQQTPAARKGRR